MDSPPRLNQMESVVFFTSAADLARKVAARRIVDGPGTTSMEGRVVISRAPEWRVRRHAAFGLLALCGVILSSCGASRQEPAPPPPPSPVSLQLSQPAQAPFSVSLVPMVPVPIRVGTNLGFRLSSSTAGYGSLYLIDPVGQVSVLAENMPLAAGSQDYPSPEHGFTLAASQPVGVNRVILLVTRQPFDGFSVEATLTLTRPVKIEVTGERLVVSGASAMGSKWSQLHAVSDRTESPFLSVQMEGWKA